MSRMRRAYTIQFKQQMVQQIESGFMTLTEAGKRYGINYTIIGRWREQFREGKLVDGSGRAEITLITENEQLKRKIGELVMEIEHLKKLDSIVRLKRSVPISVITAQNLDRFQEDARSSELAEAPSTTKRRAPKGLKRKRT